MFIQQSLACATSIAAFVCVVQGQMEWSARGTSFFRLSHPNRQPVPGPSGSRIATALNIRSPPAPPGPSPTDCEQALCIVAPCSVSMCPGVPGAVCTNDYCGGCNAIWTTADNLPLTAADCASDSPTASPSPDQPLPCQESIRFDLLSTDTDTGFRYTPAQSYGVWFRRCPNTNTKERCFERRWCHGDQQLPHSSLWPVCMDERPCHAGNNIDGVCLRHIPCEEATDEPTSEPCIESITFETAETNEIGIKYSPTSSLGVWFRPCDEIADIRCFEQRDCHAGQELPNNSLWPICMAENPCFGGQVDPFTGGTAVNKCLKKLSCDSAPTEAAPSHTPTTDTELPEPCEYSVTFVSAEAEESGAKYYPTRTTGIWFKRCNGANDRCFEKRECRAGIPLPKSSLWPECRRPYTCTGSTWSETNSPYPCLRAVPCDTLEDTTPEPESCIDSVTLRPADVGEVGRVYEYSDTNEVGVWFDRCPGTQDVACFERKACLAGNQLPSTSLWPECRQEVTCTGTDDVENNPRCLLIRPCDRTQ